MSDDARVIGTKPWLPAALERFAWVTEPVPAVRLAALRIAVGALVAVDALVTYLPDAGALYGADSLGAPGVFPRARFAWSLVSGVTDPNAFRAIIVVWALAAIALMLGVAARTAAAIAWVIDVSLLHTNLGAHSAGDMVRTLMLFILMLSPCGAAWSLPKRNRAGTGLVRPWPLRLLMLQMALVYFSNGLHKITFEGHRAGDWLRGDAVYIVLANLDWGRFAFPWQPMPVFAMRALTWLIFAFELGFPIWMLVRRTRVPALVLGASFHVGLFLFMDIGLFPLYMLCFYVPLLPWERWRVKGTSA